MRNLMALLYYLLALFGCSGGGQTIAHRVSADGHVVIDSQVRITGDISRFECAASRSGHCHYSLYSAEAAPERFAVAVGERRDIVGLAPGFKVCAGAGPEALDRDCRPAPK
ncbi:hypothetical protein ABU614_13655 [Lysobacter firmicutimachus]|uniref:Lipoprotein n=1 Tax=Lysobacter firmicutimachus TaxID=1792846 RepID=A0AAU8MMC9_9GAMM|nr:hypothetical protein [Lysobacter antibioticus]